jgi:hypothetical protein
VQLSELPFFFLTQHLHFWQKAFGVSFLRRASKTNMPHEQPEMSSPGEKSEKKVKK